MQETPDDLAALQALLDASWAAGGPHLRSIITADRRVGAEALCRRLTGMCLLVLATVTADGRPLAGPVDGIFYRGSWYFSSSPDSVRLRHIARRPQVSATHLPEESFSVTVHGRAVPIDFRDPGQSGFRACLLGIYGPRYGTGWEDWAAVNAAYWRIDAAKMFTFAMTEPATLPDVS
ncbi:MAG TPA: pyridoxamine 5'-phosphate oxidase family protein [Actinomycetota bacterium]|nr:pyridoxamine 5'-phosphate oxidase family protein [Actinomycetota bacterium]